MDFLSLYNNEDNANIHPKIEIITNDISNELTL